MIKTLSINKGVFAESIWKRNLLFILGIIGFASLGLAF